MAYLINVIFLKFVEFFQTSEDLEKEVAKANMTITARASFLTEPKTAVGNLKAQDARIIVGVFYVGFARRVFCEVSVLSEEIDQSMRQNWRDYSEGEEGWIGTILLWRTVRASW